MTILLDANVIIAYENSDDVLNRKAMKLFEDIFNGAYGPPIISDYVFDEIMGVISRKVSKEIAKKVGNDILNSEIHLLGTDKIIFDRAWEVFVESNKFSFTDAVLIASAEVYGIDNIATFDKEFKTCRDFNVIK